MFSSTRLTLARNRRGLTKKEVAEACGVSRRTVSGWESGEFSPSEGAAEQLIRLLDFPREFFYGKDLEELAAESASFRALTAISARQVHRVTSSATLACEVSDWISQRFVTPSVDIPDLSDLHPEDAAQTLRGHWNLGDRPLGNLIHIVEAHGARVFSLPGDVAEVDAFSLWRDGTPHIFLNTVKSVEHGRFDVAHELGHLVLHKGIVTARAKEYEQEAHAFASAFLMPAASVYARVNGFVDINAILRLKTHWNVSALALTHRLHRLQLLSDWSYRSIIVELTRLGYRKGEPGGAQDRESSKLLAKVFASLRAKGMTKAKLARELSLRERELDSLIFGLVLLPVEGGGQAASRRSEVQLRVVV